MKFDDFPVCGSAGEAHGTITTQVIGGTKIDVSPSVIAIIPGNKVSSPTKRSERDRDSKQREELGNDGAIDAREGAKPAQMNMLAAARL